VLHLLELALLSRKRRGQVDLYGVLTLGALSDLLLSPIHLSNLGFAFGPLGCVCLEHQRRLELPRRRLKLIGLCLRLARVGVCVGNPLLELCDVLLLGNQDLSLHRPEAGCLENTAEEPDLPKKFPYGRIPNYVRRGRLRIGSRG
jgi:hypothetical protein